VTGAVGGAWERLAAPPVGGAATSRPQSLFPKPSSV
jgi:hypothetical protein